MADPQPPAGYTLDVPPPPGYTVDSPASAPAAQPDDLLMKALNYRTGNNWADAPLGLVQGAAKGALSTLTNAGDLVGKLPPVKALDDLYWNKLGKKPPTADQVAAATTPSGIGQGTGKFLEQAAEFALPAREVGAALEAAPVLARAAGQAGASGLVSAAQSGGNPAAIATGAALGAGGELAGAAVNRIRALAQAKPPTLENFRDAFAATPGQLPAVTNAMPTLAKYGITPAGSIHEMQDAVQSQIGKLGQQYQAMEASGVGQKTMQANDLIDALNKQREAYVHDGHVLSANEPEVAKIDAQIKDIETLSKNGQISFTAVRKLRDAANGRTNFQSPEADQSLYRGIGNVYRGGLDQIEPGTAELNRDYANLAQVGKVADKNISFGRGVVPSRFDQGLQKAAAPQTGVLLGQAAGELTRIPGAKFAGGIVGGYLYPKLVGPAADALKNAVANGQLAALPQAQQTAVVLAARLGDTAAVLRMLGKGAGKVEATRMAQQLTAGAQ